MNKKNIMIVALAMVLVAMISIGGTIAWLTDKTGEVKNTFTPSNINVGLTESTGDSYQIIPGVDITKDPKVSASSNVDYYVFVEVTKANWTIDGMNYTIATGWTLVPGTDNVYYQAVKAGTFAPTSVLAGDKVTVAGTITDETLEALTADTYPTLTFQAYAIQQQGFTSVAAAWAEAQTGN